MVAGLQALDSQLAMFVIAEDYKMAWSPPLVGPLELQDHPLEMLYWEPKIASRLRAAVRADASFGRWVGDIMEKRQLAETIVREAGLHTGERNAAIDLHYFAREHCLGSKMSDILSAALDRKRVTIMTSIL